MAQVAAPRVMPAPPPAPFSPFRTVPGRLLVLASVSLALVWLLSFVTTVPTFVETFRKVASLALRVSVIWLAVLVVVRFRRQFLWRVRRKLILSYVFLGFVPVVLVLVFVSVAGFILHVTTAAYLFHEGIETLVDDVHQIAVSAAYGIGQAPITSEVVLTNQRLVRVDQFRNLSLAVIAVAPGTTAPLATAGPWRHIDAPGTVPAWVVERKDFKGVLAMALPGATMEGDRLLIRAAVLLPDNAHAVVVDLPVDTDMIGRLDENTGARLREIEITQQAGGGAAAPLAGRTQGLPVAVLDDSGAAGFSLFRRTVMFMDFTDWSTGNAGRVSVSLDAPLSQLLNRMSSSDGKQLAAITFENIFSVTVLLAVLLLIVQGVALFFGAGLGRQITFAVHELFTGTERVQQGDFTHRINIDSQDQLGALADSFNRMSASIEHLLHVQREKQRLDDELRIARDIQQSLLPEKPPEFAGLTIADLCVPAREVGGDYYDFFHLGPRQLGVLVADVSGKGTSAALYMAELKGLMLALSHEERSPKRLLTRVNRLLADHLDNRSFITMTYAVIDLEARTLTHARAGHTPLLVASDAGVDVLVPNGMVLGLRLPGISERFESLLEEHTRPIAPGDAIVFYTDGITEAMDITGELFTDAALSRVIQAHHTQDAAGIRERVLREVKAFVGEAEPHDDMTMVIVKVEADA
jgi:sigma-B regulation protein RsbU (phosphoserine phosphatase)